ncbi:GTP cyclohydrolase I FolE2 [Saccharibacillus sp. O23]|uniref:GTP cyclohydrolase FolE2 n=1 Tax=Saccharibacillus sp. O23 TaxID=2009338 RepID=UPI000B4E3F19|nr:GTP cyclohydrolase FolE2 [Saccharibacillus sp. O23]OWR30015.1 GTP cyclohydrolase I FolE2 [Saccharibacillus sp. O23]
MPHPSFPSKKERHRRFGSVPPTPGSKATRKEDMTDLQNALDDYLFDIQSVGVAAVKHPILFLSPLAPYEQMPIATLELTTTLDRSSKGINMSRLTEQLEMYRDFDFTSDSGKLGQFARDLAQNMNQRGATVKLAFPWFYERTAPESGQTGLAYCDLYMEMSYEQGIESPFRLTVGLDASVTTLCPCSKEISEYGAHNQRGTVHIRTEVDLKQFHENWCQVLLDAAESNASSMLYPILKRTDEKKVTERAYENPRFVEDLARLVAADLIECPFARQFTVECRNEESIHQHNAIARIVWTEEDQKRRY